MVGSFPGNLGHLVVTLLLYFGFGMTGKGEVDFGGHLREVVETLEEEHVVPFLYDPCLALRTRDLFLNYLDPERLFLTQKDFSDWDGELHVQAEEAHHGDLKTARELWELTQPKAKARLEQVLELIAEAEFTFDSDASWEDRADAKWAKDEVELDELWNRKLEWDFLNLALQKVADQARDPEAPVPVVMLSDELREELSERYRRRLERLSSLTESDVVPRYIRMVARSYDPHCDYFSPQDYAGFLVRGGRRSNWNRGASQRERGNDDGSGNCDGRTGRRKTPSGRSDRCHLRNERGSGAELSRYHKPRTPRDCRSDQRNTQNRGESASDPGRRDR